MGTDPRHRSRSLLDEHKSSGLTVKAFCKRKAIHEKTFYYHRRKALGAKPRHAKASNRFLRVQIPLAGKSSHGFEIQRGDTTIRLPTDFHPEQVRALLALLLP
jgi:hypothetical protein